MAVSVLQRRVVLALMCLLVLVLAWRITAQGLGQHHARGLSDSSAVDSTLLWLPEHAQARFMLSQDAQKAASEQANLLAQVIEVDPSNGLAVMAVARQYFDSKQFQLADEAASLAITLAPAHLPLRLQAADYWLQRNRWDKALGHWSQALKASYDLRNKLFPVLLAIAENPDSRPLLKPVVSENPNWWSAFFAHATTNAVDIHTVRALFAFRRLSEQPLSIGDRQRYFNFLKHEGRWSEAYIAWLNSVPKDQVQHAGLLFNGGFEYDLSYTGFDWQTHKVEGAMVEVTRTHGISGEKALHLVFRGLQKRFTYVYQHLLLTPGKHRFHGKVRPDSLKGETGLQWQIRCLSNNKIVGRSERFLGVDLWREFSFEFDIPSKNCGEQEAKLVVISENFKPVSVEGEIWFDDLVITRM